MKTYFLDTSFLIAIFNKDDKFHSIAVTELKEFQKENEKFKFYTSDYVIDEFLNGVITLYGIKHALELYNLITSDFSNIFFCNERIFHSALELLKGELNERKPLNFTDCVIYISSSMLNCDRILTYDQRLSTFKQ